MKMCSWFNNKEITNKCNELYHELHDSRVSYIKECAKEREALIEKQKEENRKNKEKIINVCGKLFEDIEIVLNKDQIEKLKSILEDDNNTIKNTIKEFQIYNDHLIMKIVNYMLKEMDSEDSQYDYECAKEKAAYFLHRLSYKEASRSEHAYENFRKDKLFYAFDYIKREYIKYKSISVLEDAIFDSLCYVFAFLIVYKAINDSFNTLIAEEQEKKERESR